MADFFGPTCELAAGLFLCGCRRDISGTYLASDEGTIAWLQLVKTPDNHLSGQLATSARGSDGRIQQDRAPVTGAVDAGVVTISISKLLGLANTTMGGTIKDDQLTLSGPTGCNGLLEAG